MSQEQLASLKEQQLALADSTQDSIDALKRVEARRGNTAATTRAAAVATGGVGQGAEYKD